MNRVTAPWVRTRLRAAPGAAVALAVLVALTACLAAAFPRALDRYTDAGLRQAVERTPVDESSILVTAGPDLDGGLAHTEESVRPERLTELYRSTLDAVERPLVIDKKRSSYGVRSTDTLPSPDEWLPRPDGLPAELLLAAPHGLADHTRLRSGRLPEVPGGEAGIETTEVQAAVTEETARTLHVEVGSVIHLSAHRDLTVRVTGIVTPEDADSPYWSVDSLLRAPSLRRVPGPMGASNPSYWVGGLLVAPEAAPAVLGATPTVRYWHLTPSPDALHSRDLDGLASAVASLESGPGLERLHATINPLTDVTTGLDAAFTAYGELRGDIGPLVVVAASGAGTVAAVVLLMAGGLAGERRRAELALLRARGASVRGMVGRLLAETAVVAVPAGALGFGAALLALPGARLLPALWAAAAVTAVAALALPLRAAAAHHAVRIHDGRRDVASARASRRRTVAELTVVVLALGAVEMLRRRGATDGAGDLVAVAPVLVGVIAALVLVRLYPLPLRGLARPARRLRGAVGPLALARAGRTSASAVLPLLALLTAFTVAAFGGSVLNGVADARDRAALLSVGADARVEAEAALPAELAGRLGQAPGVREVTEVGIDYQAKIQNGRQSLPLATVDPAGYAALAGRTGLGAFPAGELGRPDGAEGGSEDAVRPALASPAVAERLGTDTFHVRLADGTLATLRIVLVRDRTPAVNGDDFLVVDRAGLPAAATRPNVALLTGGDLDAGAVHRAADDTGTVHLRSEERGTYVDSPLQSGGERIYTAAVAAAAGYAALALLLSLASAAPERAALLARLRTMGLTRAQGRRLLVLESLPQALPAALGGILTGWAAVRLLSPGIDLTTLAVPATTSPAGRAELSADPWSLAVPAVAVLVLAVGVAAVQAWWSGRRGAVAELRAGDAR
ncbi:FtsX-like permease family protein [Streptomyces coelicolor]|uniref:FtsX-like permease family protein n=1 Tax=Streptomyces TaxID=1883 RepID=UPI00030A70F3|nr:MULTISPECIES: FtsX-like permease family protein [Streptomyces]MDX2926879.1 FtsX-like permease family protein [Streptomyces sp. NRRL_B-16638]NSL83644.1 ABC transporter permease [Streptomyces coelicolor]QKN66437.1 ABC transporter permease [Streptomyces coelicolor]TYP03047.1 putative ABC transport system permease protein [Streptomyces coelicolor]TYP05768.1 putative ABC transport system permease protein [Streptomyces coelicolor A3(2)]